MKKGYFVCSKEALSDMLFHYIDRNWKRKIHIEDLSIEHDILNPDDFWLRIDVAGNDLPDGCDENPEKLRFRIVKEVKKESLMLESTDKDEDCFSEDEFVTSYKVEILTVPPEFR